MREKQENERRGKGLKQYIADRRLAAVSLVLGVLMGLMILLGIRYSRNELIYRTAGQFLGQLAGWAVCMTVMVWAICVGLDALGRGWPEIRDFQFRKFLPVNSYWFLDSGVVSASFLDLFVQTKTNASMILSHRCVCLIF